MTALTDLQQYLTTTLSEQYDSEDDALLLDILNTEIGDQANRVRDAFKLTALTNWLTHPAPLREAILRRCARNLALRKLPLGLAESDVSVMRIPAKDNEVRRLEAPYLRLSVG